MKHLPLVIACLSTLLHTPCAAAGDLAPVIRHENIEATDSSVQRCFVFTSTPGVFYRIERSNNLSSWTTEDEIYGLGHELVTPMCEQAAPPPPPPGGGGGAPSGSGPVHVASISIRPSSGVAGGTVVSWRSLDHGGAMTKLLPLQMSAEWNSMPLFAADHGNHFFLISIPGLIAVAPPAEEPAHGIRDAAMWADLETHFPAMDQAVEDSVANARLQPPPSPPDPDSRRFWRVFSDWSLDTDRTAARTGWSLKSRPATLPQEAPTCGATPSTRTPTATAFAMARNWISTRTG